MIILHRGAGPLTWNEDEWRGGERMPSFFVAQQHALPDGRRMLLRVTCPSGHVRQLSGRVHRIAPDGTVSPSLVCGDGCPWHVFVRLADWPPVAP